MVNTGDENQTILVDASGLACPLPLLKARQALQLLNPSDRLIVVATDPQAAADFEEFCEHAGHELIEISQENGILKILLQKTGAK